MQGKLMSGYDKAIAGHMKLCRAKSAHPLAGRASPSLDRIKICCEEEKWSPSRWVRGRKARRARTNVATTRRLKSI